MTNRERCSSRDSSRRLGRCAMSMWVSPVSCGARYMTPPTCSWWCLLRVELDDQLLLDQRVDLLADRELVHEDAHAVRADAQPRRDRAVAGGGAGHLVRKQVARLLADLDDVVLAHAVRRDVDLAAVHHDVAVAHLLAGRVTRLGETSAVDHVVEPALEDLEQVLTGLAGLAVGFLVVVAELLLEDAVDAAGLLLLTKLELVLRLLGTAAAVPTRRVRTDLDGALRGLALLALEEELGLLPAAELAVRTRITSHFFKISWVQTRRRLGGRQPLCGTGVTSWIEPTSRPVA